MSRIIAGSRGGRRFATPAGSGTRPTTDRVREALFSAIASWAGTAAEQPAEALRGLAVLDLFAGSGAIGLEAASRGAAPVHLVEANRKAAELVRVNAAQLDLAVAVSVARVEQYVRQPADAVFDVIFLDPPYDLENAILTTVLKELAGSGWLAGDGLVVVERSARSGGEIWPDVYADTWSRRYGETELHFGQR